MRKSEPVDSDIIFSKNDSPVFIIAEAGVNHNGSLKQALRLVEAAKAAGADAVKFQLFNVDEQISKGTNVAEYQHSATGFNNMKEMATSYDLSWDSHKTIKEHCNRCGIQYLSSCFDRQAVDYYLSIGGGCIKIASGEITNYPLLEYCAVKQVPIILSVGMASIDEVREAVKILAHGNLARLALMHCVSEYPVPVEQVNLKMLTTLSNKFLLPVGFSDHCLSTIPALGAVAMGARLVEKHFTTDKSLEGPDHKMSLDPKELTQYILDIRSLEKSLGSGQKIHSEKEKAIGAVARRSVVSKCKIPSNSVIIHEHLTLKRPGTGIHPRFLSQIVGRKTLEEIPSDVLIDWSMLA